MSESWRRRTTLIAALVSLAALVVLLGACGEDDRGEPSEQGERSEREELSSQRYAEELRETMVGLGSELQAVENATTPKDLGMSRREVEALGETIRRTVDEFGAIDPPNDAQEGHDRILAALEDFSSKYNDVAEAVEADGRVSEDSFTALRAATFELQDQYLQGQEILIDDGIETWVSPVGG